MCPEVVYRMNPSAYWLAGNVSPLSVRRSIDAISQKPMNR